MRLCPVCNLISDNVRLAVEMVGGNQFICHCACGMIYSESGLFQADYDAYYRERNKYSCYGTDSIPEDTGRHEHTLTWLLPFVNHHASVLDFGCATGNLLKRFLLRGFDRLTGFDPSPESRKLCEKNGFRAISDLTAEQFDCVTISHVLEHVYDVQTVFPQILQAVKSNGIVYIEVPDATRYKSESPFQDFNFEHVNHFSLPTLCSLAGRFGLVPLHVGEKSFKVGDGQSYNAIFGVFRKVETGLGNYIEASQSKMNRITERLTNELEGVSELLLWGAGQLSLKLLSQAPLNGLIAHLVDSNPVIQGQRVADRIVLRPEAVKDFPSLPILVASVLNEKGIAESIQKLGVSNRVIFLTGN